MSSIMQSNQIFEEKGDGSLDTQNFDDQALLVHRILVEDSGIYFLSDWMRTYNNETFINDFVFIFFLGGLLTREFRFMISGYAGIGRLFLDNWMRRTSNVELARIPYNDGRRHGPYESHHLLRHQGIKKTIGYASTLAVVLIKIHVGRKLNAGDTKGISLEFGKWVYGGGKKLPSLVRRRNAKRDLF
ncbi:hypothetical protein C1646_664660 [Rhizophagus diaphanus]|nr:hypothetical protein C1646_664660 [Rhizophagus diaphanus] [Rhizophagus sp. MUCL 43196]